jgi:hypothetical protein
MAQSYALSEMLTEHLHTRMREIRRNDIPLQLVWKAEVGDKTTMGRDQFAHLMRGSAAHITEDMVDVLWANTGADNSDNLTYRDFVQLALLDTVEPGIAPRRALMYFPPEIVRGRLGIHFFMIGKDSELTGHLPKPEFNRQLERQVGRLPEHRGIVDKIAANYRRSGASDEVDYLAFLSDVCRQISGDSAKPDGVRISEGEAQVYRPRALDVVLPARGAE